MPKGPKPIGGPERFGSEGTFESACGELVESTANARFRLISDIIATIIKRLFILNLSLKVLPPWHGRRAVA
jgi:hypothetical protein